MSRQNYYQLLELDYDVDNYDEIKKAILQKRAEWSKLRNHPTKSNEALAKLEALKGIEEVMQDPDQRIEEAEEAKRLDMEEKAAEERKKYAAVDAAVAISSKKGWIEEAEIQLMADLFHVQTAEVKNRVTFPIENRPVKQRKKKREKVNISKAKEIAESCEKLGIESAHISGVPSLYDYLQLSPTSSTDVLIQATDEKFQLLAKSKRSASNNIESNLRAHCRTIFLKEREQYDKALSQLRLLKMDNLLQIVSATKVIQPAVLEQLKKEAMGYGDLTADEAQIYLEAYCKEHDIETVSEDLQTPAQPVKKCGFCGLINRASNHHCSKCQTKLDVTCPTCGRQAHSSDQVCGTCGFELGNMANVPHLLAHVKRAIYTEQFDQAKQLVLEILDWWPNHPTAQEMLALVEANEKKKQESLSTLKELMGKNHFYTARSLFIEERKLVQMSLSLQSMEKESLEQIHLAESYLKRADSVQEEAAKAEYYLKAIEAAADCEKAKRMLAKWPPSPPSALQVSSESTSIALKWQASTAKGPIVYRLLRKKDSVSNHFQDGEILQESADCSYTDYTAEGGYPYYYSLYAIRGSIVSKHGLNQGPFIRRAEVDNIEIIQENNFIELKWTKPPGASTVEVWRKEDGVPQKRQDGNIVKGVTDGGVIDQDVIFGKNYGYLIVVVYQSDEKTFYSEGLTRKSKMVPLPKMVQNVMATRKEDGIIIDWDYEETTNDQLDIYYSYSPFSNYNEEPISLEELPDFGKKLSITKSQQHAFLSVSMKKPVYLLPVTQNDEVALIGKMIVSKEHPEVRTIRHWMDKKDIVLQWDWPHDVKEVVIVCGEETFPKSPQDPNGTTTRVLSKRSYDALNGYKITAEKRDYYFSIFTRYEDHDELIHSNGVQYLCMNSEQVHLRYFMKVSNNFFSKKLQLHIQCDVPITLPSLVLIKKAKSIPTKREQGEDIYRIPPQKLEESVRFDIPFEHVETDAYAKLFFENEQDAQKIRLQAENGKESMRLW